MYVYIHMLYVYILYYMQDAYILSRYIYVCMYACMYACMHVCMYLCMHVCMYVCMYTYNTYTLFIYMCGSVVLLNKLPVHPSIAIGRVVCVCVRGGVHSALLSTCRCRREHMSYARTPCLCVVRGSSGKKRRVQDVWTRTGFTRRMARHSAALARLLLLFLLEWRESAFGLDQHGICRTYAPGCRS